MQVPSEQVVSKKRIGQVGQSPVIELGLAGGLHLVVVARNGGFETLGVGPHRAIARHIAKKREPKMIVTELQKSVPVDPARFAHLLPECEALTDRFRRR